MTLKGKVAKGFLWILLEKFSMRIVSFGVTLVLARLLTPDDYGTVALLTIFTSMAGVLVDSGFGQALVQKKDATELDFNSVFYFGLFSSVVMYLILFIAAPMVAAFYKIPELTAILRTTAVVLVFHSISSVQNAELNRKMLFNLSFRIALVSCVVSSVVGIVLAFMGYGAWALVWQTVVAGGTSSLVAWFLVAWRPRLMFSFVALRTLFSFGWKMVVSSLLSSFFSNLSGMLIGKIYSRADLAFVNKGDSTPNTAMDAINGTLGRVAFPALAQMQDDPDRLREAMRKMIRFSTLGTFPMMTLLAVCAPSVVRLLFGPQWMPCVPYMQLACVGYAMWPFHTINLQAITAMGRSDIFLFLEIIKKLLVIAVIVAVMRYGVLAFVCATTFFLGPVSLIINAWPSRRLFGYTIPMQLRDAMPMMGISLVVGIVCFTVEIGMRNFLGVMSTASTSEAFATLMCQSFVGLAIYLALFRLGRLDAWRELGQNIFSRLQDSPPAVRSMVGIVFGKCE